MEPPWQGQWFKYVFLEFFLQCLQWLLQKVEEPSIVHDILWQFSAALCDHPVHQTAAKAKAGREKEEKGDKVSTNHRRGGFSIQTYKHACTHVLIQTCMYTCFNGR